jgi:hypothetical protein
MDALRVRRLPEPSGSRQQGQEHQVKDRDDGRHCQQRREPGGGVDAGRPRDGNQVHAASDARGGEGPGERCLVLAERHKEERRHRAKGRTACGEQERRKCLARLADDPSEVGLKEHQRDRGDDEPL